MCSLVKLAEMLYGRGQNQPPCKIPWLNQLMWRTILKLKLEIAKLFIRELSCSWQSGVLTSQLGPLVREKGSRRVIGTKRHLFCTNQSLKRDKYKKERTNITNQSVKRDIYKKERTDITNQSVKRTKLERNWVLGGEVGSEKWKCWENILLSFHSPPERDRLTDTHRKDKQKNFKIQFCEKWKCR